MDKLKAGTKLVRTDEAKHQHTLEEGYSIIDDTIIADSKLLKRGSAFDPIFFQDNRNTEISPQSFNNTRITGVPTSACKGESAFVFPQAGLTSPFFDSARHLTGAIPFTK